MNCEQTIFMVGLVDFLCMLGMVTGTSVGSALGFKHFGVWDAIGGGLASFLLCSWLARWIRLQELLGINMA